MTAPLTIVTGASRGMGLAMAQQLIATGHHLICISRKTSESLDALAKQHNARVEQWSFDLADGAAASERLRAWLASHCANEFSSATLINNAALLPKISPLRVATFNDIATTLRVGLESVMQLTAAFLGPHNRGRANVKCSIFQAATVVARWPRNRYTAPSKPAWITTRAALLRRKNL
jgi:benzil reductase ((S)-benzoin forming)